MEPFGLLRRPCGNGRLSHDSLVVGAIGVHFEFDAATVYNVATVVREKISEVKLRTSILSSKRSLRWKFGNERI